MMDSEETVPPDSGSKQQCLAIDRLEKKFELAATSIKYCLSFGVLMIVFFLGIYLGEHFDSKNHQESDKPGICFHPGHNYCEHQNQGEEIPIPRNEVQLPRKHPTIEMTTTVTVTRDRGFDKHEPRCDAPNCHFMEPPWIDR